MNDEQHPYTPREPEQPVPAPQHYHPEWPRPKPVIEKPRISRKRKIIMIAVIAVVSLALFSLRKTVDREKNQLTETQNLMNATITSAMGHEYGGSSGHVDQLALVTKVANAISGKTEVKTRNFKLRFHLLKEPDSINCYSLTTGDIYLTTAILNRMQTEGQLAAVMAHAAAHVMAGDAMKPVEGLSHPLPVWGHTVTQEAAADARTVMLMAQAGYDPNALIGMLGVLANAYHAGADVMFFTSHPNAEDRIAAIQAAIAKRYPQGVPEILSK